MWGTGTHFRWQQIRPGQDYDDMVFVCVFPDRVEFYEADKQTVTAAVEVQDEKGNWIYNQHGGKTVNSGTFCLDGFPKRFLMDERSMIENKDCLEYLSTLDDDSVDLVVTDPPYFIGFDGGKGWDSQWKSEQEYLDWCEQWTAKCVRVLKPNRMLCVGYTQD